MPVRVRTKLLVVFVGTVVLLIVVGVLGLRVLGQSNARVESLGALQQRATAYREIQTDVTEGRLLLGLRAGGKDVNLYAGHPGTAPTGRSAVLIDNTIRGTFAQVAPATNVDHLGFRPQRDDAATLGTIRSNTGRLLAVIGEITDLDRNHRSAQGEALQSSEAEPLATKLSLLMSQPNRFRTARFRRVILGKRKAGLISSWSAFLPVIELPTFLSVCSLPARRRPYST